MSFAGIILDNFLGQGVYGNVYKIHYKGKDCALKILGKIESEIYKEDEIPDAVGLPELSELNTLSNIKHPNLIELIDFKIYNGKLGFILPLARSDMKIMCGYTNSRYYLDKWIYEIISAVFFLHKHGFYHCDIKLSNILILDDNRACLADFGLVKRQKVSSSGVCQSIDSPQSLYRKLERRKEIPAKWKYKDIASQPSTEVQDDIWALGFTIYKMCESLFKTKEMLKYNDYATCDYYIDQIMLGKNMFVDNGIPVEYAEIIKFLLNPIASERNFSLLELLKLSFFKVKNPYLKYIDGRIVNVENSLPVVEYIDDLKPIIRSIMYLDSSDTDIEPTDYVRLQLIDLYYRCIEYISIITSRNKEFDYKKMILTVLIVLFKTNKTNSRFIKSFSDADEYVLYETVIVNHLRGHITRDFFADYIDEKKYKQCIALIHENPMIYESYDTMTLVQFFNANIIN